MNENKVDISVRSEDIGHRSSLKMDGNLRIAIGGVVNSILPGNRSGILLVLDNDSIANDEFRMEVITSLPPDITMKIMKVIAMSSDVEGEDDA